MNLDLRVLKKFILQVLAETQSWKTVNDLIHNISDQIEKPKK